jgi:hypothetical protein
MRNLVMHSKGHRNLIHATSTLSISSFLNYPTLTIIFVMLSNSLLLLIIIIGGIYLYDLVYFVVTLWA